MTAASITKCRTLRKTVVRNLRQFAVLSKACGFCSWTFRVQKRNRIRKLHQRKFWDAKRRFWPFWGMETNTRNGGNRWEYFAWKSYCVKIRTLFWTAGDKNIRMPTWAKKAASCPDNLPITIREGCRHGVRRRQAVWKSDIWQRSKDGCKKVRFLLELNEMPNEDGRGAIAFVRNVFNFLYARNFSF